MRYFLYRLFWIWLDWFFPPKCVVCEKTGTHFCNTCQSKIIRVKPPFCEICGTDQPRGNLCLNCVNNPPHLTALRSWAIFDGPIREAIHQLKYRRNIILGQVFSDRLREVFENTNWDVDLILPVPLGVVRQKKRGYNQAALLAYPLALQLNCPYNPKAIQRIRETESQVGLDRQQRKMNVNGAFLANPKFVSGKNILVIDDITTSGATMNSCAEALLDAGAKKVYGLTLARA